jgi:hypothetical protein
MNINEATERIAVVADLHGAKEIARALRYRGLSNEPVPRWALEVSEAVRQELAAAETQPQTTNLNPKRQEDSQCVTQPHSS